MKKIVLVIILSISLTVASIIYKQRQAEAIPPVIVYIAAAAAITLIGKIIKNYFFDASTQLLKQQTATITASGSNNSVNLNWSPPEPPVFSGTLPGGRSLRNAFDGRMIVYANDGVANNDPYNFFPISDLLFSWSGSFVPSAQVQGVNEIQAQILASPNYSQIGYYTEFEQFVGANSRKVVRGYRIPDQSSFLNTVNSTYMDQGVYVEHRDPADTNTKLLGKLEGQTLTMWRSLVDVPANCYDGVQNQNETGIDTGGVCPAPPAATCSDGIQNQGETGVDCGGPCPACPPPPETCFDGIMNQDETGIDYGGVCGIGGNPANPGPQPQSFIDQNLDGIDDISGFDAEGNVPIGLPAAATSNTFDTSLPGAISDIGPTDWGTLILDSLSSNPLVRVATGTYIAVSGANCRIDFEVYGKSMSFDFCSIEWMVDFFGIFVLGIMSLRSVFIAFGIE